MCPRDVEVMEQTNYILSQLSIGFRVMGLVALAMSAQVQRDDTMILGEIRKHARLDPCSLDDASVSMNQHYGFTSALVYITNANPVRVEKFVFCGRHSRHRLIKRSRKHLKNRLIPFPFVFAQRQCWQSNY